MQFIAQIFKLLRIAKQRIGLKTKKNVPKKCILCKETHETYDHCSEFKKKELEQIKKEKKEILSRFDIQMATSSLTQAQLSLL